MRYTKNDIKNILLTEFMAALGEKPAVVYEGAAMYYPPYRDDPEPIFLVNTRTNIWHDYATDDSGGLKDLATLAMNPDVYKDPIEYILKMMNEYEQGKELSAMARPTGADSYQPRYKESETYRFYEGFGSGTPGGCRRQSEDLQCSLR